MLIIYLYHKLFCILWWCCYCRKKLKFINCIITKMLCKNGFVDKWLQLIEAFKPSLFSVCTSTSRKLTGFRIAFVTLIFSRSINLRRNTIKSVIHTWSYTRVMRKRNNKYCYFALHNIMSRIGFWFFTCGKTCIHRNSSLL